MVINSRIFVETEGAITRIYLDGEQIEGVRAARFIWEPNTLPILQLDLNAMDAEISIQEGRVEIKGREPVGTAGGFDPPMNRFDPCTPCPQSVGEEKTHKTDDGTF